MYETEEAKFLFIAAVALCLLLLLSLIIIIILFRRSQNNVLLQKEVEVKHYENTLLKKELEVRDRLQKEKERISLDLHDDLGSTLSAIGLHVDILKNETKNAKINNGLSEIIEYTQSLTQSMKEIMWSLDSKNDNIQDFINYIKNYIHNYFEKTTIQCTFKTPLGLKYKVLDNSKRRQLYLIIKELCHNIFKHSSATEVVFEAELNNDILELSIQDNGVGIENINSEFKGNGMKSIRKRAVDLKARLVFKKVHPKGLKVKIHLRT